MKKLITIILLLMLCLPANIGQSQTAKMFGQIPSGQYADGLVFYWRGIFAGNAVDESGNGNHGTINGPMWVGQGLSFDTFEAEVTLNQTITFPEDTGWSITWRSKKAAGAGANEGMWIGEGTNTYYMWFRTSPSYLRVNCGTTVNNFTGVTDAVMRSWHTYSVVAKGDDLSLYIDGVHNETIAPAASNQTVFVIANIGAGAASSSNDFKGLIEFLIIHNRALSASEIAALTINPDLPMAQDPIWILFSPEVGPSGIVPIIQAHARRRHAG